MTQVLRSGVELDVCPQCRGVWLDRGDLEKLLQPLRDMDAAPPSAQPQQACFLPNDGHVWEKNAAPPPFYPGNSHHDGHYKEQDHQNQHGWNTHNQHQNKGWRGLLDVFD
jgi:hypothetical protein